MVLVFVLSWGFFRYPAEYEDHEQDDAKLKNILIYGAPGMDKRFHDKYPLGRDVVVDKKPKKWSVFAPGNSEKEYIHIGQLLTYLDPLGDWRRTDRVFNFYDRLDSF